MDATLPALVILFVAIAPLLYALAQYNALVSLRNHIRESWADIDTELKRRYDLIPRLVEVARGYAAHERAVFERIAELRTKAASHHSTIASQAADESELVAAIRQLFAVAENYPELKADQHFLELQRELVRTEDRIQAARRFYNGNVRDYRNKCESFPSNIVASVFGFGPAAFFDVEPSVREAPAAN
jgi:Uncharacterized conserved protein